MGDRVQPAQGVVPPAGVAFGGIPRAERVVPAFRGRRGHRAGRGQTAGEHAAQHERREGAGLDLGVAEAFGRGVAERLQDLVETALADPARGGRVRVVVTRLGVGGDQQRGQFAAEPGGRYAVGKGEPVGGQRRPVDEIVAHRISFPRARGTRQAAPYGR